MQRSVSNKLLLTSDLLRLWEKLKIHKQMNKNNSHLMAVSKESRLIRKEKQNLKNKSKAGG